MSDEQRRRTAPGGSGRRRRARRAGEEPPTTGAASQDREADPREVARTIALRKLTAAPQSRATLEEALARKDVPTDAAAEVLDRFTEVGLVDDAAYARMLVRTRHEERHLGRRALAQELRCKGIDDETAREALEQVDDEGEYAAALAVARKKARTTAGLDDQVRRRRMVGALGRRGFGGDVARRALTEALEEEAGNGADESFGGGPSEA